MKIIGILGGMGADTSAHFYQLINRVFQQKYGATQDTDFAEMIIYNCPLRGFTERGFEDSQLIEKQIITSVKKLESFGVDFIVIPCNTVHFFIDQIRKIVDIPILNIIEETIKKISKNPIGIICSETTNTMKLYQAKDVNMIYPDKTQQKILNQVIRNVIAGRQNAGDTQAICAIIDSYRVEQIILGCTELPLAITPADTSLNLLNTLEILAETAVDFCKQV